MLGGSANVNVTGTANWSGGTMTGAGATNIPAGATLNLNTGLNNHLFLARTLNNAGTAILTQAGASGTVFFLQSGTFNNQAGGVFDIRADRGINSNGGTNLFANAGVIRKSAGTGLSTVGVPFNNNGTVEVQTGTLEFSNGGTSSGAFNVGQGTTLEFGGGAHTLTAASSVNAANAAVSFSSGTVTVAGSYNAGTTTIGSAATFNSSDVTIATLNLQNSGALSGSANVNVTGTVNWSGGTMSGSGATNIPAGATLNLNTGLNNHLFLARTLNNAGTAILTQAGASGTVFFLQSGTFNNQAGGVFDIRADRGINSNGGTNLFANAGVIRKSAGTGLSTVGVPFNNNGTVEVQTGTFEFSGGGTSSGAFNVGQGTTLEFGGGAHTLTAASSVNAANAAVSFSGGTVTVAGSYNAGTTTIGSAATFNSSDVTIATLNLQNSGALSGSANVNVTGTVNWSGGTMSGSGATNIPAGATLNLNTGLNNHLFLARTLNNAGTAILTQAGASGTVFFLQSGTFNNQAGGVFDIRADRGINSNGGTNLFANAGVVRKSAGTGVSTVGIPFNNTGTVEMQTGTLDFGGTYTQTAGATLLNGGTLSKTSGGSINIQGGRLMGTGNITGSVSNSGIVSPGASPGCLSISGNYTQTSSGVLDLEIGGTTPCTQYDQLNITGTATLAGTLNTSLINGFTPTSNNGFIVMTFGARTGTFGTVSGPFAPTYNSTNVTLGSVTSVFTISGQITNAGGSGISDVTVSLNNSLTTTTNAGGNYSFNNLAAGGNYTVTPSQSGLSFNPPGQTFNNLNANQTANFTAASA